VTRSSDRALRDNASTQVGIRSLYTDRRKPRSRANRNDLSDLPILGSAKSRFDECHDRTWNIGRGIINLAVCSRWSLITRRGDSARLRCASRSSPLFCSLTRRSANRPCCGCLRSCRVSGVHAAKRRCRQDAAGTQVQAKLVIATLVNRTVIPEGAILSGRVIESMAMSANTPSRLAIYMDSARWKAGSAAIKVYLTAWYYPWHRKVARRSLHRRAERHVSQRQLSPRAGRSRTAPPADDTDTARISASRISDHRLLMKDVESARDDTGALTLTSSHSNLRLDKLTVYVLAPDTLLPPK